MKRYMSEPSHDETSAHERRLEEVLAALLAAEDAGRPLLRDVVLAQNAELADELRAFLGADDRVRILAAPLRAVAVAGGAAATTERDSVPTVADSPPCAGLTAEATETLCAIVDSTIGPADDPDATAPNSPNGTVEGELNERGTRVRYFGDYELLSVLGRGGMGVVYRARQISLNRPVALKMLQAGILATEDDLRRFQNEAEAVAMLDHPHIVPILEVGNYEDQRYFSMKLIGGPSLDRKLDRFIDDPKTAARLVRTAAEAVHHAHIRGILHRDLKPANILLDERGGPHVTDFGLAKRVHGDSDLTQSGAILGTPPYMAPEQASGKRGMVTTATDIYGLGAILYALLAGRAPFSGDSPLETLEQVRERIPEPPSKYNLRVPRDLEVICLKCLEKQPERRYGSAQALAEDLRRYLNNEAILARPVGVATRALMWCARNRALTRLGVALALTMCLAALCVITAAVIEKSRRREEAVRREAETNFDVAQEARRREETARLNAEATFDMAQKAVEDYLTNVSENTLLKEQESVDIRRLRQDLLKSALTYYEQFAAQRKNDPRLREQLAKAYFRVGQITGEIGTNAQAMAAFRSALAIWGPLVDANPQVHELAGNIALCYLAMGRLESHAFDYPAALLELLRSSSILERLIKEAPDEPRYQASLADCYVEIGIAQAKLRKPDESLAIHEKARAIQQALIDRYPDKLAYRQGLAENLNAIGYALYTRPDRPAALKTFHEVEATCQALLKQVSGGPKPSWLLNLLALSLHNIGNIHKESGEINKALPFFEESLRYRSDLADSHPSVTRYREKLGVSYRELAELERNARQNPKAFQSILRAIDIFGELERSQPDSANSYAELGLSWNDKGILYDDARNHDEAIHAFTNAVAEQQTAIRKSATPDFYKTYLWNHLENLGEQYLDLGRPDEGLPFYRQAQEIRAELSRAHPENMKYTLYLVEGLIKLGTIERHVGDVGAARRAFAEAKTILEKILKPATGDAALQLRFAIVLANEAATAIDQSQPEKAKPLLEDAADRFRKVAGRAAPDDAMLERESRSEALWDLGRVLRGLKRPAEADRVDLERIGLWEGRPLDELVAMAVKHARRADLIGYGQTPVSAQAKVVRELDLDLAASELRLAVARGFIDLRKLGSDPDAGAACFHACRLAPARPYNPGVPPPPPRERPVDH